MDRILSMIRQGPIWRQLLSCALAYALIVQGILFALGGAQLTGAASAEASSTVEICLHDPADATGLPNGHADGRVHCPFCLAGAHHAIAVPWGSPEPIIRAITATVLRPGEVHAASFVRIRSHPPRGPPLGA
jgi:hypothetical protein